MDLRRHRQEFPVLRDRPDGIGQKGGIVGAYVGPAEWDGPEARALIEHYLNRPASAPGHAATVTKTGG